MAPNSTRILNFLAEPPKVRANFIERSTSAQESQHAPGRYLSQDPGPVYFIRLWVSIFQAAYQTESLKLPCNKILRQPASSRGCLKLLKQTSKRSSFSRAPSTRVAGRRDSGLGLTPLHRPPTKS